MQIQHITGLIATNPSANVVIPKLLQIATEAAQAQGAYYFCFDQPHLLFYQGSDPKITVDAKQLQTQLLESDDRLCVDDRLPPEFAEQYNTWLYSSLRAENQVIGAFVLVFRDGFSDDDSMLEFLSVLKDALTIVTTFVRQQAYFQKLMHNKNEFSRVVTHDMRTPLTAIRGYAELLELPKTGALNEKQRYYVSKIQDGISKLEFLVDNIQGAGIADPETGFYEVMREPCDLRELVEVIIEEYIIPARKQNITLITDFADPLPEVNIDIDIMERAITNLIDNAVNYTPDNGRIVVGVHQRVHALVISVQDNGVGISKEDQERIFDQYFRIRHDDYKHIRGSGLGLFIVKSAAYHHGGEVWLESEKGKGTTFYMSIPLVGDNVSGIY